MIEEAICSKEICLLVEQNLGGTPLDNVGYYDDKGNIHKWNEINFDGVCQAFSQSVVMRWLREVHNFHITIMFSKYLYGDYPFYWSIDKMVDGKRERTSTATADYTYKTYEEAVEAALKYCLENLI